MDTLELKRLIHAIVDCIQGVLGYVELGEYIKAEKQARQCIKQLGALAIALATMRNRDRGIQ